MNLEKCMYVTLWGGGVVGGNAALKAELCDFKPLLGMQIRRNGMGYVSYRKRKLWKLLCSVA